VGIQDTCLGISLTTPGWSQDEARLERVLPVVTTLAFKIQDEYNQLVNLLPEEILQPGGVLAGDLDEIEDLPEGIVAKAFVVSELSKLAVGLDYADEIGRRKMFQLACGSARSSTVRTMIS
jgi:condensin complex subunit 3